MVMEKIYTMHRRILYFTIDGDPFGKLNLRPMNAKGHASVFNPKENADYMEKVSSAAKKQLGEGSEPDPDSMSVAKVHAYFQIPKRLSKRMKMLALQNKAKPTKKPDLDSISKVVLDGIAKSQSVWKDDSQAIEEQLRKYCAEDPCDVVVIEKKAIPE